MVASPTPSFQEKKSKTSLDEKHAVASVDVVEAQDGDDDQYLEQLGYKPEFRRDFTFIGLFSLVSSELAVLPGVAGTIWCVRCHRALAVTHTVSNHSAGTLWDTLASLV